MPGVGKFRGTDEGDGVTDTVADTEIDDVSERVGVTDTVGESLAVNEIVGVLLDVSEIDGVNDFVGETEIVGVTEAV